MRLHLSHRAPSLSPCAIRVAAAAGGVGGAGAARRGRPRAGAVARRGGPARRRHVPSPAERARLRRCLSVPIQASICPYLAPICATAALRRCRHLHVAPTTSPAADCYLGPPVPLPHPLHSLTSEPLLGPSLFSASPDTPDAAERTELAVERLLQAGVRMPHTSPPGPLPLSQLLN